jgi:hypothetical protein
MALKEIGRTSKNQKANVPKNDGGRPRQIFEKESREA